MMRINDGERRKQKTECEARTRMDGMEGEKLLSVEERKEGKKALIWLN